MAQKAWIVTLETSEMNRVIIDVQNARKKIGQIDQYLGEIFYLLWPHEVIVPAQRLSGVELMIEKEPYILRAQLAEIDGGLYDENEIYELQWQGLDYERFELSTGTLQARLEELNN